MKKKYGLVNDDPVIITATKKYVNVFEPTPEMFCIEDIAHSLSQQCRFGGHTPVFFSVAQHCINCLHASKDEDKLSALLHDASEAYLLDIPRPIKNRLSTYHSIEDTLMKVLAEKFEFQYPLSDAVKKTDSDQLQWEWENVINGNKNKMNFYSPTEAKSMFLQYYYALILQPQHNY